MLIATLRALARGTVVAATFLLLSVAFAADSERWTLVVKPSGGGCIDWETSSPARDGTTSSRKVVTFDTNTFLDVWIEAKPGYELVSFAKDEQEMIWFLDIFNHLEFGPVSGSHTLTATFLPVLPSGTFDLSAPLDNPAVTNMVDLTGNYTGVTPTRHARGYALDVAQDESGKVIGMGTVEGIEPTGGGPLSTGSGKVSTVNGEPTASAKGRFKGTRDGAPAKGTGSLRGAAELQGPGEDMAEGSLTYNTVAGGVKFKDKNVPAQAPLSPASASNVSRDWGIRLDVFERAPTKSKKPYVAVTALLTLPNGDVISFPEKKAKYTAKNGLKVTLKKGLNTTIVPNVVDKKSKVTIKKMTLEKVGDNWFVTGGQMKYAFLGQKGIGDVLDFLTK